MRSFVPALVGLATVAVAQNVTTDCVTAFSKCYDFDLSNSGACEGQASHCKDSCSQKNAFCLQSGKSSAECQSSYDECIGATSSSVVSINCISSVTPCYTGNSDNDHTCDSKMGECKTACSAVSLCSCRPDSQKGTFRSDLCFRYAICACHRTATTLPCVRRSIPTVSVRTMFPLLLSLVSRPPNKPT